MEGSIKALVTLIGIVALASGLLFVGQGTGYIPWPSTSFMIGQIRWVYYGAGIAVVGLLLLIVARR